MQERQQDLIVVLPGILGSVLVKNGRGVWGNGSSVVDNLITFGGALDELELPRDLGDDEPRDGVAALRLLPRFYMLPSLWKADGYGKMVEGLTRRLALRQSTNVDAGNILEFPYDWRLSNGLNARRLAGRIQSALQKWRDESGNKDAKITFICHSMGGLIARHYIDTLGGWEHTNRLVTIGTPYRGSLNALQALINDVSLGVRPLEKPIHQLIRSFPSVYELLPTFNCLNLGDGILVGLRGKSLPHLDCARLEAAMDFHEQANRAASLHRQDYKKIAIKGIDQPTAQSGLLRNGRLEVFNMYKGKDYSGDGTVPRPSAHPADWSGEEQCLFYSQTHALLQSTDAVIAQLYGILTDSFGAFMGSSGVGICTPSAVIAGQEFFVEVTSAEKNPFLSLNLMCEHEAGVMVFPPRLMKASGSGSYRSQIDGLPEGAYRFTAKSASPSRPIDAVSDWTLVMSTK